MKTIIKVFAGLILGFGLIQLTDLTPYFPSPFYGGSDIAHTSNRIFISQGTGIKLYYYDTIKRTLDASDTEEEVGIPNCELCPNDGIGEEAGIWELGTEG